jgi:POT family proton-dependent oligopeptide transporter
VVKAEKQAGEPFFNAKNVRTIIISLGLWAVTALLLWFVMKDFLFGMAIGLFIGFIAMIMQMSTKDELPKTMSLILVFVVVVFFWMSFHQNGLTLTYFARDYTVKEVGPFTNIFFNLKSMLSFLGAAAGLYLLFAGKGARNKTIGGVMLAGLGILTYFFVKGYDPLNAISPEVFQSFNPLFIVVLTFPIMGFFAYLRRRNSEPSTPKKIGIGMIIAAVGFVIILIGSQGLIAPSTVEAQNLTEWGRISPYWLISTYLTLTVAELFLSPMGLSFVSKVAPTRFQGLMQGGWLLATATGNKLLFVGSYFWERIELWQIWFIFVICCIASAAFIFSIMKRLEKATN